MDPAHSLMAYIHERGGDRQTKSRPLQQEGREVDVSTDHAAVPFVFLLEPGVGHLS